MADVYDLAVVGAGPAGCSVAREFLERLPSASVLVIDALARSNSYNPSLPAGAHSQCSGGMSRAMLERVGWAIPSSVRQSVIRRAVIKGPNSEAVADGATFGMPNEPLGAVYSRPELDDWLISEVLRRGGEFRNKTRIISVATNGYWHLGTKGGEAIVAKRLVGCDGPESLIARTCLGATPIPPRDMCTASEVYLPLEKYPRDQMLLEFDLDRCPGYYWQFAAARDGVTKVGVGATLNWKTNPARELDWYRERESLRTSDAGYLAKPHKRVGGRITVARPLGKVADSKLGVAVAGEAARAVIASLGAGDAMAIQTGRMLGKYLAEDRLDGYQSLWRHTVYKELRRHWRLKNALLGLNNRAIDKMVTLLGRYRPTTYDGSKEFMRAASYLAVRNPATFMRVFLSMAAPW